jgi:Ca2+-binding RTX toxin-like protein
MYGGDGNDTIAGGAGGATIYGGTGNDVLICNARGDELYGERGNDLLKGGDAGGAAFDGGKGSDTIYGTAGADTITAGAASDWVEGRGGGDLIDGDTGWQMYEEDALLAGQQADTIYGGRGDDTIFGNGGDDVIDGGNGDDHLFGDMGSDTLTGGAGNDILGGDGAGLSVDMHWTPGNDLLDGGMGDDWLEGRGPNFLWEQPQKDTMTGGAGSDVIDAWFWAGDVMTDRQVDDFVPGDVPPATEPQDLNKVVTLYVTLPDSSGRWPLSIDFPFVEQRSPGLSFTSGTGRVEIYDTVSRPFVLKDFFWQWGLPIDRSAIGRYRIIYATVNGVANADIANYVPKDGDTIRISAA